MMNRTQSITAIGILCVLLVLGSLDAFFTRENFFPVSEESAESSVPNTEEQMEEDDTSYTQSNVADIIQSQQFTTLDTQESSIMEQVVDETEVVRSHTLLKDNDRAGFVAWLDSTRTELYFRALKEALHESFSPQVQDLIDDVLSEE